MMNESLSVSKTADAKGHDSASPTHTVQPVREGPENDLSALRKTVQRAACDDCGPSDEGIAAELAQMPLAQRASAMMGMQQTLGNRYVGRLAVQAKLALGPVGDRYEQEADRVAQRVVETISSPDQGAVQRQEVEEEEDEELRRKVDVAGLAPAGGLDVGPDLESAIQRARGGGQPLSDGVRQPMERAFGADFGGVRIHADGEADSLNRSIQARAFTTGQDIFLRQGEHRPGSSEGQRLLAHELTHVVQQNRGAMQRAQSQVMINCQETIQRFSDKEVKDRAWEISQKDDRGSMGTNYIEAKIQVRAYELSSGDTNKDYFQAKKEVENAWKASKKVTKKESLSSDELDFMKVGLSTEEFKEVAKSVIGSKPGIKIILPESEETPEKIWTDYLNYSNTLGKFEEPEVPWLAVKDLFASVTFTGDKSWEPVVRQQFTEQRTSCFTVFTGMHGNLGGQFLNNDEKIADDYKDNEHTLQDEKTAEELRQKGFDITLIDVFAEDDLRKPEKLRDRVKGEIAKGRVVILAWCYSMEGFKAVPKGTPKGSNEENVYVKTRNSVEIKLRAAHPTLKGGVCFGAARPVFWISEIFVSLLPRFPDLHD